MNLANFPSQAAWEPNEPAKQAERVEPQAAGRDNQKHFPVLREFKFEVRRCHPKGCEKVAGGRSEAKTTG